MKQIVVLGRGGAGKSVLAARLAAAHQLPLIELDQHFWQADLTPTPPEQWRRVQAGLIGQAAWVADGDLGPYDYHLTDRLAAADTIIMLDLPLLVCAWRALRRSRENRDFWRWVIRYRHDSVPVIKQAITAVGAESRVHWLTSRAAVARYLANVATSKRT
ncbi:MAG: hypothetical protein LBR27_04015 [Bifidobacteriaceae bacterium]|jgi:adenylate kinase family enzyme|nr:hypothetical protein [Bifidobacteriaceae bacterium]